MGRDPLDGVTISCGPVTDISGTRAPGDGRRLSGSDLGFNIAYDRPKFAEPTLNDCADGVNEFSTKPEMWFRSCVARGPKAAAPGNAPVSPDLPRPNARAATLD